MNERRHFLKLAAAGAVPVSVAWVTPAARADDDDRDSKSLLGAWRTVHSLPFPPGSFRENLTFAAGGVLTETNTFLHTNSNLDFSAFGLPNIINASDGMGNWERAPRGQYQFAFRKLLFDGMRRHFGDLRVTGVLRIDGGRLSANAHVRVVDLSDAILADFGFATTEGVRIS